MAFRSLSLIRLMKSACIIRHNVMSTQAIAPPPLRNINKPKEYIKTEEKLIYLEDPDTFGTLSRRNVSQTDKLDDEGDVKEEEFIGKKPLRSQQLTIKQYSDLIKQYLKHKRLKDAIDVLEVRMLKEDRVKPSNYIYNILIGACAEVGYTKKAFKLFNEMKRRELKATGDTYTCLFEACSNSPWAADGLKYASNLRNIMIEKGVEPNLTNYNAMIKAFGRCGDLATAFKIVDEMASKKIKIRVHTLNNLLHACISDKESGLRHALIIWRKMLRLREKPNLYSFNLMLKCVKECNLGSKEDMEELIRIIRVETPKAIQTGNVEQIQIISEKRVILERNKLNTKPDLLNEFLDESKSLNKLETNEDSVVIPKANKLIDTSSVTTKNVSKSEKITMQFIDKLPAVHTNDRTVPNLLSKVIKMDRVLSLQNINSCQDKFAIIGGQEDFLKEMEVYDVKPDIKTFTQMLTLLDDSLEAENKLLDTMKQLQIKADIDFYNMLIKKRCLRSDYENAVAVKVVIAKEDNFRKKRYPNNKKLRVRPNVMTYGVLALACRTQESAEQLLSEMKDKQLRINIQVLGALLRQGTVQNQFGYVVYIMKTVKEENVQVNEIFLKHLEEFNDKCDFLLKQSDENGKPRCTTSFEQAYERFSKFYSKWLKEIDIKEALEPEHPWQQFREDYPETLQRLNYEIVEPKRFYKRSRRYVKYRLSV